MTSRLHSNRMMATSHIAGFIAICLSTPFALHAQRPDVKTAPTPVFEVFRVKHNDPAVRSTDPSTIGPGSFKSAAVSVAGLIASAYDIQQFQVEGMPDLLASQTFSVEVKEPDSMIKEVRKLEPGEKQREEKLIFQSILQDSFHLQVERETRDELLYLLKPAPGGPRIQGSLPAHLLPDGTPALRTIQSTSGHCPAVTLSGPIGGIAGELARELGSRVIDRTDLAGDFNLLLTWCPDDDRKAVILSAVPQQLGMELELQQGQVEILHVEQIEMPAED